jgi:hypothetical protein
MNPKADAYRSPQFDNFIKRLESIERRYVASGAQRDLLDLLFTLGAQAPAVRELAIEWLKTAQWVERGIVAVDTVMKADAAMGKSGEAHRFVGLVRRLARALLNLGEALHERDVGNMEVPADMLPPEDKMLVGSPKAEFMIRAPVRFAPRRSPCRAVCSSLIPRRSRPRSCASEMSQCTHSFVRNRRAKCRSERAFSSRALFSFSLSQLDAHADAAAIRRMEAIARPKIMGLDVTSGSAWERVPVRASQTPMWRRQLPPPRRNQGGSSQGG